jgi:hypothetical protein
MLYLRNLTQWKFLIVEIIPVVDLLESITKDNIKINLREIGFGSVDWIHVAQDRDRWRTFVNMRMNLRVP